MEKKLYKSKTDKKIAGVCGGIAEYFGVDSMWVRLGWILIVLCMGTGLLAYIICAIVIPEKPENFVPTNNSADPSAEEPPRCSYCGSILNADGICPVCSQNNNTDL